MSFFNIKKQAVEPGQRQESDLAGFSFDDVKTDYLYLDMLPTEMPDEMWARIRSVMNLFKKEALSPSVITGDLELDATSRFMSYRDKKKLFLPQTSYHNFYDDLHHRGAANRTQAAFGTHLLEQFKVKPAAGSRTDRYLDDEGRIALKIAHDDRKRVTMMSFFHAGQLTREDSYDEDQRLFASELYAQLPDFQQISLLEPVLTNTTIQATIFNIGGVPIINALPLIKQYWLNNQAGEPVHMFTDMNAILVWWLTQNFLHTDRKLYIDASSELFVQLVNEPAMHDHLIPIINDEPDQLILPQLLKPLRYLVNEQFIERPEVLALPEDVQKIDSWHHFMS
ncbi:hypothetical protein LJ555_09525 [Lacticaseibacillus paracasei]|uniref:hypothetical protein n=1 Tax=Lacticaseibacillus paracasei TaxID=1597 RepID=UPI000343CF96|nr:hypothetical protein [Lacticaseibacillus paracasei]EPC12387.1 hypothetical protein Lpp230_1914 [Lacticaseibacillus paracasei subsp. paracasei Lpp230]MCT3361237.1 hypothetical protein [Lacticaseibacillus paracasei]UNG77395.1 hypothetical protein LJ555_09525 [Lacticaseibacillus paracasei]